MRRTLILYRTCAVWVLVGLFAGPIAGQEVASFKHGGDVKSITFSPDGKTLVVAGFSAKKAKDGLKLCDVAGWKEVEGYQGHLLWVESAAFSPDGKHLASSGGDNLRLWDVSTKKQRAVLDQEMTVLAVAFSPDSKILAAADGNDFNTRHGGKVVLWDVATAKETVALKGHESLIYCVAFSPDGKLLATVSYDGSIRLWDSKSGKEQESLKGYGQSVAFSPDGKLLAYPAGAVKLREVATGKEKEPLKTGAGTVRAIAFTPDGKLVAAASYDNEATSIQLWEVNSGKELAHVKGDPKAGAFGGLAISPDGKLLAASQGALVKVWEIAKLPKTVEK